MFSFFKRKPPPPERSGIPRGVLPTYVTERAVILIKASPRVRNTYEIRLALFMAKSQGIGFVLGVSPTADVDASIADLLREHGGVVERGQFKHHSVYMGRQDPDGNEEGWVLGNDETLNVLISEIRSEWLRERMKVGARFEGELLEELEEALKGERIELKNIDEENVRTALLSLIADAKRTRGVVFVQ